MVPTGILPTLDTTNNAIPIGGVKIPIIKFRMTNAPKKIGSIPTLVTTGINTGTTRTSNANASINVPNIIKSKLINNNKKIGSSVMPRNVSAT